MKIKKPGRNSGGFVALFFVLSFATALGLLVFGLTQKSQYMLSLLRSVRDSHNAKSAVHFCLQRLIHFKTTNIGYRPSVGVDVPAFGEFVCRYTAFDESAVSGALSMEIKQEGVAREVHALRTFSVDVTSSRTGGRGIVPGEVLYRLQREYYITDAI